MCWWGELLAVLSPGPLDSELPGAMVFRKCGSDLLVLSHPGVGAWAAKEASLRQGRDFIERGAKRHGATTTRPSPCACRAGAAPGAQSGIRLGLGCWDCEGKRCHFRSELLFSQNVPMQSQHRSGGLVPKGEAPLTEADQGHVHSTPEYLRENTSLSYCAQWMCLLNEMTRLTPFNDTKAGEYMAMCLPCQ